MLHFPKSAQMKNQIHLNIEGTEVEHISSISFLDELFL